MAQYGAAARKPFTYRAGAELLPRPLHLTSLFVLRACRPLPEHGLLRTPSRSDLVDAEDFEPLELWSMEASPFCKIVRERLYTRIAPHVPQPRPRRLASARPSPSASVQLPSWRRRAGVAMLPWLHDPNTGFTGGESAELVSYLQATYGTGEAAVRDDYTTVAHCKHGTVPGSTGSNTRPKRNDARGARRRCVHVHVP